VGIPSLKEGVNSDQGEEDQGNGRMRDEAREGGGNENVKVGR
jgi:hypothetical protein